MTVDRDALRSVALSLPAGSAVPVPKEWLLALLDGASDAAIPTGPDYTVAEVAVRFGRATSTIRGWILSGALRAYKLQGREHRITPQALEDFEARQRSSRSDGGPVQMAQVRPRRRAVDLAAFRHGPPLADRGATHQYGA